MKPSIHSWRRTWLLALAFAGWLGGGMPAVAWTADGHERITDLAVSLVATQLPSFFSAGRLQVVHGCVDPDLFCERTLEPALAAAEGPEHYLDWELLGDHPLPPTRPAYAAMCADLRLMSNHVGALPYALLEWTERLELAFAEYRRWPENPQIAGKCLVDAGTLAHYAGDATQPLHLTLSYDGRAAPDGSSPHTGIHLKVDALVGKLTDPPADLLAGLQPRVYDNLFAAIQAQLRVSHSLVDQVYALAPRLPALDQPLPPDPDVQAFVRQRTRAGAGFLASLYLTAWQQSATLVLPAWLESAHTRHGGGSPWDPSLAITNNSSAVTDAAATMTRTY